MFRPVRRLLASGVLLAELALLFFAAFYSPDARAEVGGVYQVFSFRPYLERGYNTRLGWQGWPVTADDPHLYLYSADKLRLLTELEFLQADGRVYTQIFKVYQPNGKLDAQEWDELEYFALEASRNRLGPGELQTLIQHRCKGEWAVNSVYVTLIAESSATWLRISEQPSASAQPWSACVHKKL